MIVTKKIRYGLQMFLNREMTSIKRINTRFISTLSWKEAIEHSIKFMQKNIQFVRIYGPKADEIPKDLSLEKKPVLLLVQTVGSGWSKIDIVILNAAVFGLPWTLTEDGLETTFQVNYLSQYYLLMSIEKILAPDARVIFTSSESHRNVNWDMNKILSPTIEQLSIPQNDYTSIKAYNVSKVCCILAMHYLGYRWLNTGKTVICAHPGSFIKTRLCRNWWVYETLYTLMLPFSKTVHQAANTLVYCATSPDLNGLSGMYIKEYQRCDESDIARDTHLSFRVNDLTRDILRERVPDFNDVVRLNESQSIKEGRVEETIDNNTFISNYSN